MFLNHDEVEVECTNSVCSKYKLITFLKPFDLKQRILSLGKKSTCLDILYQYISLGVDILRHNKNITSLNLLFAGI